MVGRKSSVEEKCSFCGKRAGQVRRLMAGPGDVFICDECVGKFQQELQEDRVDFGSKTALYMRAPLTKLDTWYFVIETNVRGFSNETLRIDGHYPVATVKRGLMEWLRQELANEALALHRSEIERKVEVLFKRIKS